jgi:hypothetical protein
MLTEQEALVRCRCKSITVVGRRWFQRSYGNTYHTADIYVDGVLLHTLPVQYGYGNQYLYNAALWLRQNGYLPEIEYTEGRPMEPLWRYCQRKGIALVDTYTDVQRRRDL